MGLFESDSLCAWLTADTFADRVLGASDIVTVPTRNLLLVTGNNVSLKGDLCRRILTCRIDPGVESPWKRGFDLNPAAYCAENRLQMVAAALTVLRTGLQNAEPPRDRTASFEDWSDLVRRAVIWVRDEELMDVADPVGSIDASYDEDPETTKLRALLQSWRKAFDDSPRKVAEVITASVFPVGLLESDDEKAEAGTTNDLREALVEIAGQRGEINPRILGHWLKRMKGRIVDGLSFIDGGVNQGIRLWAVKRG